MGRETKFLLALLATLAGVFVGVLSMKLLVSRPPAGAGPDVDVAAAEPHELVAPPTLSAPPSAVGPEDRRPSQAGSISAEGDEQAAAVGREAVVAAPRRDPFVATASLEQPLPAAENPASPRDGDAGPSRIPETSAFSPPLAAGRSPIEPAGTPVPVDPRTPLPATASMIYVTVAGDSWWDLAERAYGDGRLYRALFAWNRVVDPRVTLAPGTRLEIPPLERLEAAWPKLAAPRQ